MSDSAKKAVLALGSILLCAGASAIVNDSANPYQGIVERNVFGLKPPPEVKTEEPKAANLPPITLTGMTTILSSKRALLSVHPPGKQPQSYILAEGQRDGEIEVLEIDEKAGAVKVRQSGTIVPLTFAKNGAKLPVSVPIATGPGIPTAVTPGGQLLGAANLNPNVFKNTSFPIPQRQIRDPGSPASGASTAGSGSFGSGLAMQQPQRPAPEISGDEGAINMLVQHVQKTDEGTEMPPLPPPMAELLESSDSPQQPPSSTPRNGVAYPPRAPGLPSLPPPP